MSSYRPRYRSLIALLLLLSLSHGANALTLKRGDANEDGKVNIQDVVLLLHAILGQSTLDANAALASDVAPNPGSDGSSIGDGKINVLDAVQILRYIAGFARSLGPDIDATPASIDAARYAVLQGKALSGASAPLPGVAIRILEHPEYGTASTGADGSFQLTVNGGEWQTVVYEKSGYLPVQRKAEPMWKETTLLDDVAMTPLDTHSTPVQFGASSSSQTARGSVSTDQDGSRQATLLFPDGTGASLVMPDGSKKSVTSLTIRATEYTVGADGPKRMPADLPPATAYTYAVELSADEAMQAGAKSVEFDRPVPFYVENFLNFPVGGIVPIGWYDRESGAWIASDNGRVIKILSVSGGLALLDVTGGGSPASASDLQALGISDSELKQLATLYSPGQSLWRSPLSHFTPWDCNWPYAPPDDAVAPNNPPPPDPPDENQCQDEGSVIEPCGRTLGESIPIAGTPFNLVYRSDRIAGRKDGFSLKIPASGASVPASLAGIQLEISVAGRATTVDLAPTANQTYVFTWDGKDSAGQTVTGKTPIVVRIGYRYKVVYMEAAQVDLSFGRFSSNKITGNETRDYVTLWQEWKGSIGSMDERSWGLGGWSLSVLNSYDANDQTLYLGSGEETSASDLNRIIRTVTGSSDFIPTPVSGSKATQDSLFLPIGVAAKPDGGFYFADVALNQVYEVDTQGTLRVAAGSGESAPSDFSGNANIGDGGLATKAKLTFPSGIALAPDGSLYVSEMMGNRIRKITPDGIIATVAGNGFSDMLDANPLNGDGGPAISADIEYPLGIAVDNEGNLYIAETMRGVIRKVNRQGIISTFAGKSDLTQWGDDVGDGGLATKANLDAPNDVAVGPDGSVYIADTGHKTVRKVDPYGVIRTVAGGNADADDDLANDGMLATKVALKHPIRIAVSSDGVLFISDDERYCIRRVGTDGIIQTVAGTGNQGFGGDNGPGAQAMLDTPQGVAVNPNGDVYIADTGNRRIREISSSFASISDVGSGFASSDGKLVYIFDGANRHVQTLDATTGGVIYQFSYVNQNQLDTVTDRDGNVTRFQRDSNGNLTSILSPFGYQTKIGLDAHRYLASLADPAGGTVHLTHSDDGLLTSLIDPNGNVHLFAYDGEGRLATDTEPTGGSTTLTTYDSAGDLSTTVTTGMGRKTVMRVQRLSDGGTQATNQFPDGSSTVSVYHPDGTSDFTSAEGVKTEIALGSDPRFGMQAPILHAVTQTTPGGLTSILSMQRIVTLSDATKPLSLKSLAETTSINGRNYIRVYDAATKTTTQISPMGRQFAFTFDDRGHIVSAKATGLAPLTFAYDTQGRLTNATWGTGDEARSFTRSYDPKGELSQWIDPSGSLYRYGYDGAGRLASIAIPDQRDYSLSYDLNGNLAGLTSPGGGAQAYGYTPIDSPASFSSGDASLRLSYNADRQLTQIMFADGTHQDFTYDAAGRLIQAANDAGAVQTTYDAGSSLPKTLTAPGGVVLSEMYDGILPTGETWAGPVSGSYSRSYDANLNVVSETVGGSAPVAFAYDKDNLLVSAGDLTIVRDALSGSPTELKLGTVDEKIGYDDFGEAISSDVTSGSSALYSARLSRDKLGRVTEAAETIAGQKTVTDYDYDASGRLVKATANGAPTLYGYDANDNRTSVSGPSGSTTAQYDTQDRLTKLNNANYGWDTRGYLQFIKDVGSIATYAYDSFGDLREADPTDGKTIHYVIDGRNRRIGKRIDGDLVQGFLYRDAWHPVAELGADGQIASRFVYGDSPDVPDYLAKGGVEYRIIRDFRGSPRLAVNAATGEVAQRLDYDAFGNVTQDTRPGFQPFGFAGGLYDSDTGLVRFGARDYDPASGRWTARDPILHESGQTNYYVYCGGDPINGSDPTGEGDYKSWSSNNPPGWKDIMDSRNSAKSDVDQATSVAKAAAEAADKGLLESAKDWASKQIEKMCKPSNEYKQTLKPAGQTEESAWDLSQKIQDLWNKAASALGMGDDSGTSSTDSQGSNAPQKGGGNRPLQNYTGGKK